MLVEHVLPVARGRLVTVRDDAMLLEAAQLLVISQIDLVVVCDPEGLLAGVVTKADIVRQIGHCHGHSCTAALAAVTTRTVIVCRPSDWLRDAWSVMKEHGLKNLPIVDEALRPQGVLNARDVLQSLLAEVEDEELLLRDYVLGIGYQ